MGSSIKVMLGFEHKRFKPPALNNMHATANWFEEIDTPEANDFKKRWKAKFPDEPYINDMGYNAYNAVYMYKTLVEKAKSTKLDDMRKVIATGDACIEAPEGQVCIDPKSQHTSHRMRLISRWSPSTRSRSRRTTERSSRTGWARSAATSPRRMTRTSTRRAIFPRSRDTLMGTNLAPAIMLDRAHSRHDVECTGAATMRHRESGSRRPGCAAELFSVFYQFADVFAFLMLSAAGLAIMFGMMGVINMAHGEFIMCGAYVTVGLVKPACRWRSPRRLPR